MSSFKKKSKGNYVLRKSDVDFYKMTGVFAICCVFVLLVLKMQDTVTERIASGKNLTHNFYMLCHSPLFWVLSVAAVAASVGWFCYCKKKSIDESFRIFSSVDCLAIVGYLAFFTLCFGTGRGSSLHGFFIAITIVLAVLYYASKIYKYDFIFYSAVTAVFAVCIYLWGLNFEAFYVVIKLAAIVLAAAACVLFNKKIKALKITKKTKASFLVFPAYISLVLGGVFLFWGRFFTLLSPLFLSRTIMLAILLVQYMVFAIVYTIRLIKE